MSPQACSPGFYANESNSHNCIECAEGKAISSFCIKQAIDGMILVSEWLVTRYQQQLIPFTVLKSGTLFLSQLLHLHDHFSFITQDTDAQMPPSHLKNALQVISVPSKVKPRVHR